MSTLTVQIPEWLESELRRLAQQKNVSMDEFVVAALTEKLSALEAARDLEPQTSRGDRAQAPVAPRSNTVGPAGAGAAAGGSAIPQLNSLLRGEISAAETYRMAIDRVAAGSTADAGLLREIQEEHGRAAQSMRDRIRELGGEAVDSSGAWGAWAKTVQATMNLFGDASSLKALKEGEEHGLKDYNDAMPVLDATSREMVQNQLIPQQRRHIDLLDQMITAAAGA